MRKSRVFGTQFRCRYDRLRVPNPMGDFLPMRCSQCKKFRRLQEAYYLDRPERGAMVCPSCLVDARREYASALWADRASLGRRKWRRESKEYYALIKPTVLKRRKHAAYQRGKLERTAWTDEQWQEWVMGQLQRRREKEQGITGTPRRAIKGRERALVIEQYLRTCAYCLRPSKSATHDPDKNPWHVDHIHPVRHGGSNTLGNYALSCASCNLSKHDKVGIKVPTPIGLNPRALGNRGQ